MKRRLILSMAALGGVGCVERTMTFESNPPGALVYVNHQEVGRTPMRRNFTWYGNYDVVVRKEGYETLKTSQMIWPPGWQLAPFDLISEILPVPLYDRRTFTYTLAPTSEEHVDPREMMERAKEMEGKLKYGEFNRPPATQP